METMNQRGYSVLNRGQNFFFVRKKIKSFYVQKILSKYVNYTAILNALYLSVDCAAVMTAMGGQGIREDQELEAIFS